MSGPAPRWHDVDAVLFDLDGVLTPTAELHQQAWRRVVGGHLRAHDLAPYTEEDYFAHIDGKPRDDGVRDALASRDVRLPEGSAQDPPGTASVRGLGRLKDEAFAELLGQGIEPYPGSVRLLDHLRSRGTPVAVVSSSRNAAKVLAAAGLGDRFGLVLDGAMAEREGLAGKPSPQTYLRAAELLGAAVARTVVVEDAVSGVRAGRAGAFGLVVAVDRGAGGAALLEAGADVVVRDLDELVPGRDGAEPVTRATGSGATRARAAGGR